MVAATNKAIFCMLPNVRVSTPRKKRGKKLSSTVGSQERDLRILGTKMVPNMHPSADVEVFSYGIVSSKK